MSSTLVAQQQPEAILSQFTEIGQTPYLQYVYSKYDQPVTNAFFSDPYTFLDFYQYYTLKNSKQYQIKYPDLHRQYAMMDPDVVEQFRSIFLNTHSVMLGLSDGKFSEFYEIDVGYLPQSIIGINVAWEVYKSTQLTRTPEIASILADQSQNYRNGISDQTSLARTAMKLMDDALTDAQQILTDKQLAIYQQANNLSSRDNEEIKYLNNSAQTCNELTRLWKREIARSNGRLRDQNRQIEAQYKVQQQELDIKIQTVSSQLRDSNTRSHKLQTNLAAAQARIQLLNSQQTDNERKIRDLQQRIDASTNVAKPIDLSIPDVPLNKPARQALNDAIQEESTNLQHASQQKEEIQKKVLSIQKVATQQFDSTVEKSVIQNQLNEALSQLRSAEQQISQHKSRIEQLQSTGSDNKEKYEDLESSNENLKVEIQINLSKNKELTLAIDSLKNSLQQKETSIISLKDQLQQDQATLKQYEEASIKASANINDMTAQIDNLKSIQQENASKIAKAELDITTLKKQLDENGERLETALVSRESESLQNNVVQSEQSINRIQQIEQQFIQSQADAAKNYEQSMAQLQSEIEKLLNEKTEIANTNNEQTAKIQNKMNELLVNLREAQNNREVAINNLNKSQQDLSSLENQLSQAKSQLNEYKQLKVDYESKVIAYNQLVLGSEQDKRLLAIKITECNDQQKQITSYQAAINEHLIENQKLTMQIADQQTKLSIAQETQRIAQTNIQAMQAQIGQLDKYRNDNQELQTRISVLMVERRDYEAIAQEYNEINTVVSTQQQKVKDLTFQLDQSVVKFEQLQIQYEGSQSSQAQLNLQLRDLANEVIQKNAAIQDLTSQLSTATLNIGLATQQNESQKTQNDQLRDNISQLRAQQQASHQQVRDQMQQLNERNQQQLVLELQNLTNAHKQELDYIKSKVMSEQRNYEQGLQQNNSAIESYKAQLIEREAIIMGLKNEINKAASQTLILESTIANLRQESVMSKQSIEQRLEQQQQQNEFKLKNLMTEYEYKTKALQQQIAYDETRINELNALAQQAELKYQQDLKELEIRQLNTTSQGMGSFDTERFELEKQRLNQRIADILSQAEEARARAQQDASDYIKQIDELRGLSLSDNREKQQLEFDIQNLTSKLEQAQLSIEQINKAKSDAYQSYNDQIKEIQNTQQRELSRLNEKLQFSESGKLKLKQQIDAIQLELTKQRDTTNSIKKQYESAVADFKRQESDTSYKNSNYQRQIDKLQRDLETKTQNFQQLKAQKDVYIQELRRMQEQQRSQQSEQMASVKEYAAQDRQRLIQLMEQQTEESKAEIERLTTEFQQTLSQMQTQSAENMDDMRVNASQLQEFQTLMQQEQARYEQLELQQKKMQDEFTVKQDSLKDEHAMQIQTLTEQFNAEKETLEQVNERLKDRLDNEIEQIESERQQYEEISQNYQQIIESAKQQLTSSFSVQREMAEREVATLKLKVRELEDKYKSLDDQLVTSTRSFAEDIQSLKESYRLEKQQATQEYDATIQKMTEETRVIVQQLAEQQILAANQLAEIERLQNERNIQNQIASMSVPRSEHERLIAIEKQIQNDLQTEIVKLQTTINILQNGPTSKEPYIRKFVAGALRLADLAQLSGLKDHGWDYVIDVLQIPVNTKSSIIKKWTSLIDEMIGAHDIDQQFAELIEHIFVTVLYFMDQASTTETLDRSILQQIKEQLRYIAMVMAKVASRKQMESEIAKIQIGAKVEEDIAMVPEVDYIDTTETKRQELINKLKAVNGVVHITTEKSQTIAQMVSEITQTDEFATTFNDLTTRTANINPIDAVKQSIQSDILTRALAQVQTDYQNYTQTSMAEKSLNKARVMVSQAFSTGTQALSVQTARSLVNIIASSGISIETQTEAYPLATNENATDVDIINAAQSIPQIGLVGIQAPDRFQAQPYIYNGRQDIAEGDEYENDQDNEYEDGDQVEGNIEQVDNEGNAQPATDQIPHGQVQQQLAEEIANFASDVMNMSQRNNGNLEGNADLITILKEFRRRSRNLYVEFKPDNFDLQTIIEESIAESLKIVYRWIKHSNKQRVINTKSMYN